MNLAPPPFRAYLYNLSWIAKTLEGTENDFPLVDQLRGHVHMMSTQGGGTPKANAVWKLSKKMQTRGGGGKKSGNFADVICEALGTKLVKSFSQPMPQ